MRNNRFLITCLGLAALTVMADDPKLDRPNILFIMADDHTLQTWGVYESILQPWIKAPNIERLADEGCTLHAAYATNSLCGPSRASILTGQYSHLNGVHTNDDGLDPAKQTVAGILREAGYRTAIIGKWHLKEKPSGFDEYNVLIGQGRYKDPVLRNADNWDEGGAVYKGHSTDVITSQAITWLDELTDNMPFFLMCHFKATHEPFGFPDRYKDLYEDVEFPLPATWDDQWPDQTTRTYKGQLLDTLARRLNTRPEFYGLDAFPLEGLTKEEIRQATYQLLVRYFLRSARAIDDNIGRLLEHLDEHGLADNTIVIYTTDQGYYLGEHGMFDKRMMHEESIRMPFVIRYPKEIKAGTSNSDFILNIDIPSLFLDYAEIETPPSMQGRSFRANLRNETPDDWRQSFYYRYWTHETNRPAHFGIRTKQFKLIYFYALPLDMKSVPRDPVPQTWELYDLKDDPLEVHNIFSDPSRNETVERLQAELLSLRRKFQDLDKNYPEVLQGFPTIQ